MSDLSLNDLLDTQQWCNSYFNNQEVFLLAPRHSHLLDGVQTLSGACRPETIIAGMSIYCSDYVGTHKRVQVRFPKSKKKRIVMKWFKDPENWESWFEPGMYILNQRDIIIHPKKFAEIQQEIAASARTVVEKMEREAIGL